MRSSGARKDGEKLWQTNELRYYALVSALVRLCFAFPGLTLKL